MESQLFLVLAHGEAGEAALHNEGGDPLGALALVGHGEHHEHVGHIAVGDEYLAAVHHIVVALQLRLRLSLGGVGAGVGLRQGERAHMVPGGQHGQVLRLLLGGAVGHNGVAAQTIVGRHDVTGGGALLAQLLDAQGTCQRVGTCAAVFLGHAHTHDAQLEQLLNVVAGVLAGTIRLRRDGLDLPLGELRHHLADQLMLTAQIEIHSRSPILFLKSVRSQGHPAAAGGCQQLAGGGRSAPPAGG